MKEKIHEFQRAGRKLRFDPGGLDFEEVGGSSAGRLHRLRSHEPWEDRTPSGFSRLFLVLGERCNMACTYCYASRSGSLRRRADPGLVRRAIDEIAAQAPGELDVSAVGGEPLLEWDVILNMYGHARLKCEELGLRFGAGIITNGLLLTPDKVDFLASVRARILVSMDGARKRHDQHRKLDDGGGSYAAIARNLPYLFQSGARVEALAILKRGETAVDEVVKELADVGFKHIGVALVSTSDTDAQYRMADMPALDEAYGRLVQWLQGRDIVFEPFRTDLSLLQQAVDRQAYCNAGIDAVTLTVDGRYSVCPVLGGVSEADLGTVDTGLDPARVAAFRTLTRRDSQKPCTACWAAPVCGGGCVSRKHAFSGRFDLPAPLECVHTRLRLEWALVHHVQNGGCSCPTGPASPSSRPPRDASAS